MLTARRTLVRCLLVAYAISGTAFTSVYAADTRVALVIGNSAYPSSRLRNPVNDANAIATKLRALGFEVILRTEAGRRDMTRAIGEFGSKVTPGSMALFYYAGHGMQVKGKNFLIPVDAEIDNEDMVRAEGIDVDRVFERLKISRLNVVILDACRDNPFERFRDGSGGLAEIDAPIGTFLAYATSPGKVASDGTGANGLYTSELLKAIDVPGLKIEDVFKQVRINVLKASENRQVPWESSSMTGEFYFKPDAKAAAVDVQLRRAEQERLELQREMEKLRAEVTRLVSAALSTPAGTAPLQTASAVVTSSPAAALPAQVAIAVPAPAPLRPDTGANAGYWDSRIALLEKSRGKLNYSQAVAILFEIYGDSDLINLVRFERFLQRSSWASALAMGVDQEGKVLWANASRYRSPAFAQDTALEFCAKEGAPKEEVENAEPFIVRCELVILNSEFQEKALLALADQLKRADPVAARTAYLRSITVAATENFTPGGIGAQGNNLPGNAQGARVFTPARAEP